jgi:hypothetical protein
MITDTSYYLPALVKYNSIWSNLSTRISWGISTMMEKIYVILHEVKIVIQLFAISLMVYTTSCVSKELGNIFQYNKWLK